MTQQSPWVKICGVTNLEDAELVAQAGADAIGLNFVPGTKRHITRELGRAIAGAVRGRLELVGVFADESLDALESAQREIGLDWLQLHGSETPELVGRLPRAFKATGIRDAADVERAFAFPGERLLLDAKVEGARGGTGVAFEWSLLEGRAGVRRLIVAGGLTPQNVAAVLARLSPFGVDVASGVERSHDPRRKDPDKVAAFIANARGTP
jgi:phosphoribosylanthranilate isomerase